LDQEKARQKINANRLIAMMQSYVFNEKYTGPGSNGTEVFVEWTPTQARVAMDLLNKLVPNLKGTDLRSDDEPEGNKVAITPAEEKKKQSEWADKHNVVQLGPKNKKNG